jgi:hypothetical protein
MHSHRPVSHHSTVEGRDTKTTADSIAQQTAEQVSRNYEAFREILPTLLPEHLGKFALMKDGSVVDLFDTAIEAFTAGKERFGVGHFSMQKIIDRPVDLGYFSHAMRQV